MPSTKRIERLTVAQKARFGEFVQKWTAIGLSTEPTDRPRAEAAIHQMYRQAGLKAPRIVWCGSPLGNGLTRVIVRKLPDSVRASVGDSVGDSVRDSVWDSVGDSVRASVGDSIRASVWDSVRDSVWDSVRASVGDSVYGCHDAAWLAFYDYLGDVYGLTDLVALLAGLSDLAKSAGWALPHKGICWVSERHNVLNRDERGRLHCETGPAVQYPDGWSIYAWHGVRVPADVIEAPPAKITLDRVLSERNTEVARVLMRRAPPTLWDDPRVIVADRDVDGVGQPRQLLRVRMTLGEPVTIVRVKCPSTGGEYRLRVPPQVQTCSEAVAWTFRKSAEDYAPAVET